MKNEQLVCAELCTMNDFVTLQFYAKNVSWAKNNYD
jgi:hypothetical protein